MKVGVLDKRAKVRLGGQEWGCGTYTIKEKGSYSLLTFFSGFVSGAILSRWI
jgi:hypothetical protein